jgi:DNA invertase Pin-like site-specific DNA recombinase
MLKSTPIIRCAIYTRKSTEEGLDQDFNSLHAQREAAEAYIQSQKHLGWTLVSIMMVASPAEISTALHCSSCLKMSMPAA